MRFLASCVVAASLAAQTSALPLASSARFLAKRSPNQHNGGDVDEPANSQEAAESDGIKTDSSEDIQAEINMTPSVRLTKEMLWEASVPRYDDITQGTLIKTFKKEADARAWVYKHSGAHWSINYPMPEGINPADNALGSSAALLEVEGSLEQSLQKRLTNTLKQVKKLQKAHSKDRGPMRFMQLDCKKGSSDCLDAAKQEEVDTKLAQIAEDLEKASKSVASAGGGGGAVEADVPEAAASSSSSAAAPPAELALDPKLAVRLKILEKATGVLDNAKSALEGVQKDMKQIKKEAEEKV